MNNPVITDALGSDTARLKENAGLTGRMLIDGLDHAVRIQTSFVEGYVSRLRRNNPRATPADLQREMDKHFKRFATSSGGAAGLAAAVPGVGFVTGAAAVGAESLLFLDAAALYTVASAQLRGVDIRDPERRRALILVAVLGAPGTAIVDTLIGDLNTKDEQDVATRISRMSLPTLSSINAQLMKLAKSRLTKKLKTMWIGKILPLGIGLVVGTMANRKLADQVITNTRESMGPIPSEFPALLSQEDSTAGERKGLLRR